MTVTFTKKHLYKEAPKALGCWVRRDLSDSHRINLLSCMTFLSDDFGRERFPTLVPYYSAPFPFDPKSFHADSSVVFDLHVDRRDTERFVETWLSDLPIESNEEVYLTKRPGDVISSWSAVAKWSDFYSKIWKRITGGFETLSIFDDTLHWMVLFGPEDSFVYAEIGPVNSNFSERDNANGWDLKRIKNQPLKPIWQANRFTRINLNSFPCECQGPCESGCRCGGEK